MEFGKQIIDNYNGKIDSDLLHYNDYMAKLKELSSAGYNNTIKQFIIYQLENFSDSRYDSGYGGVRGIMLKALFNIESANDFQRLILKSTENDFLSREIKE